ncbi:fumarylacetoacetate hydrolase family protein [Sesbania bispinosa]|nr:fumarylacetoacetate hydrolase family protein [Sesbania bispinosa]
MVAMGEKSQEENATTGSPMDDDKESPMEQSEDSFVKETPMHLGEELTNKEGEQKELLEIAIGNAIKRNLVS